MSKQADDLVFRDSVLELAALKDLLALLEELQFAIATQRQALIQRTVLRLELRVRYLLRQHPQHPQDLERLQQLQKSLQATLMNY